MDASLPEGFSLSHYHSSVYRLVESQEEAATLSLVDDIEQQSVLEAALDKGKPPYRAGTLERHYLISTPFRYPPLKYGSRFGTRAMRSYFYASEESTTCLTEAAYYRFVFIRDKQTPFSKALRTDHLLFSVDVKSEGCADLTTIDDTLYQNKLASPIEYTFTQHLGQVIRGMKGDVIRYYSARISEGVNVAIDDPNVIISQRPEELLPMTCETDSEHRVVRFSVPRSFPIVINESQFLVNGQFPSAA